MTRHAQEYWLRLQAQRAIELAMEVSEATAAKGGVPEEVEMAEEMPDLALHVLSWRHGIAIADAAMALRKAELLHREIVGRGGKGA